MNIVVAFFLAILSYIFVDNVVLNRSYGVCAFVGVSNKIKSAVGMGIAVIFVMVIATLVCYPINLLLGVAKMEYMRTIFFILVIACLVQAVGFVIKKTSPSLYRALGIYLPLITTNCAVLGVVTDNVKFTFLGALANCLGTGVGFLFIIFVFACIRTRLEGSNVPKALKGVPIALLVAGILTMIFMGLNGMIKVGDVLKLQ
ncbi:MAG: Rnf-Nqr domain containing protein [Candidatus Enteromonas sp.]|nr:Rnf-Nqr domain containing protein [Candidatus Enteromonas sp.]